MLSHIAQVVIFWVDDSIVSHSNDVDVTVGHIERGHQLCHLASQSISNGFSEIAQIPYLSGVQYAANLYSLGLRKLSIPEIFWNNRSHP